MREPSTVTEARVLDGVAIAVKNRDVEKNGGTRWFQSCHVVDDGIRDGRCGAV